MNDNELNIRLGKFPFPTEIAMGTGCKKDDVTKLSFDPRF
jgi:hypothetical protein